MERCASLAKKATCEWRSGWWAASASLRCGGAIIEEALADTYQNRAMSQTVHVSLSRDQQRLLIIVVVGRAGETGGIGATRISFGRPFNGVDADARENVIEEISEALIAKDNEAIGELLEIRVEPNPRAAESVNLTLLSRPENCCNLCTVELWGTWDEVVDKMLLLLLRSKDPVS